MAGLDCQKSLTSVAGYNWSYK